MNIDIIKLTEKFPFVSHLETEDKNNYYGIILNADKISLTFIDIYKFRSQSDLIRLLNIAQQWWWYSNRIIPLNLFYYQEVEPYMGLVTHLPIKTTTIVGGHVSSLQQMLDKTKTSRKNRTLTILD